MPDPIFFLPPELHDFLRPHQFAMLTIPASIGTVLLIKAPRMDIESCRGSLPVLARYELHVNECGPVLRLVLVFQDLVHHPMLMEVFGNAADPQQLAEWQDMLSRPELRVVFIDETHQRRLSKVVKQPTDESQQRLLPEALRLLAAHDPSLLDFDRAKAMVMDINPFPPEPEIDIDPFPGETR